MVEASFSKDLLAWYDLYARCLPWRNRGAPQDPYQVWISEIMLQQTTVATVIPYFERFITRWPTLESLAGAEEADLLHSWQGLGYYSRARSLHRCAQILLALGGTFPQTEDDLLKLPGIGPYTAAALLTIAFEKKAVALDGNIIRVLSRWALLEGTGESLKKKAYLVGETLLPSQRLGDYTQALMDLGATVCTPQKPVCSLCPVIEGCRAFSQGRSQEFPQAIARKPVPYKYADVFWIEREEDGFFFLQKETKSLLKGLFRFPFSDFQEVKRPSPLFPLKGEWALLMPQVRHTFTHFKLILDVWHMRSSPDVPFPLEGVWVHPRTFPEIAFSTLMKKILKAKQYL